MTKEEAIRQLQRFAGQTGRKYWLSGRGPDWCFADTPSGRRDEEFVAIAEPPDRRTMTPHDAADHQETLEKRLRRHAHDLVNGGTNASELRADLVEAAALLSIGQMTERRAPLVEFSEDDIRALFEILRYTQRDPYCLAGMLRLLRESGEITSPGAAALLRQGRGEDEQKNDQGAELIGQAIPDVDGTEPRPVCKCGKPTTTSQLLQYGVCSMCMPDFYEEAVVEPAAPDAASHVGASETEAARDWRRELLRSGDEQHRAAAIFAVVDAACEKAQKLRRKDHERFKGDPINWADLGCAGVEVSAYYYEGDGWNFGCAAYIEEASPDCRELPEFVKRELENAGFKDVGVITEW